MRIGCSLLLISFSLFLCRLFTSGPIRGHTSVGKGKSNPSPPSWVSSSKEYFSCDSSVEKENSSSLSEADGLFSSFSQRLDLLGQDKDKPAASASAKNKTSEPRKPRWFHEFSHFSIFTFHIRLPEVYIQNLSNRCRQKYDPTISRIFLISF